MSMPGHNGECRVETNTYSVLRFFNRLKEPVCKSLILLNLRSLWNTRKHIHTKEGISLIIFLRKVPHKFNIYIGRYLNVSKAGDRNIHKLRPTAEL